jgi:hypothetical protein
VTGEAVTNFTVKTGPPFCTHCIIRVNRIVVLCVTGEAVTNFTVKTTPPDVRAFNVSLLNVTVVAAGGLKVGTAESMDTAQIHLKVDPAIATDVEYYGDFFYSLLDV